MMERELDKVLQILAGNFCSYGLIDKGEEVTIVKIQNLKSNDAQS